MNKVYEIINQKVINKLIKGGENSEKPIEVSAIANSLP